MRFIGDVHGNMQRYLALTDGAEESIQVGDFGIGFTPNPLELYDHEKHRFIRGNHDFPYGCTLEPNWIKDGHVEAIRDTIDPIMFVGGAWSIDRAYRREGIDWWADEELSYEALNYLIDKYIMYRPKVVITHEVPDFLTKHFNRRIFDIPCRTRNAFDQMWKAHQPKLWISGHWHFEFDKVIDGTRFIVLDCDSRIDIDLTGDCLENSQQKLARYHTLG